MGCLRRIVERMSDHNVRTLFMQLRTYLREICRYYRRARDSGFSILSLSEKCISRLCYALSLSQIPLSYCITCRNSSVACIATSTRCAVAYLAT